MPGLKSGPISEAKTKTTATVNAKATAKAKARAEYGGLSTSLRSGRDDGVWEELERTVAFRVNRHSGGFSLELRDWVFVG
jgi:hypothetical protein